MFNYIEENWGNLVVGAMVLLTVSLAAYKVIKDKKNHVSSCGCGCKNCPHSAGCISSQKETQ